MMIQHDGSKIFPSNLVMVNFAIALQIRGTSFLSNFIVMGKFF